MTHYRCFLFPQATRAGDQVTLDARESHHLVRVLRARAGERVELLDGGGRRYGCRLEAAEPKAALLSIEEETQAVDPKPAITLVQSVPKGKTMDLILRMATEIGVRRVVPVFTAQGEVQLQGARLEAKVDKWRMTMVEACKQCGLPFLPELVEPSRLEAWLGRGDPPGGLGLVASLEVGSQPLVDCLRKSGPGVAELTVAVGPEGDFTNGEYAALAEAGFSPVRLGHNVLRAETAAAYLLSVIDQVLRNGVGQDPR